MTNLFGIHVSRRCGSGDTRVSLTLDLDSQPQLCDLSSDLAKFMGCRQSVKGDVLQSLLVYIRMHNLQVCPQPPNHHHLFALALYVIAIMKEKSVGSAVNVPLE